MPPVPGTPAYYLQEIAMSLQHNSLVAHAAKLFLALALLVSALGWGGASAGAHGFDGAVYVLTNSAAGNAVAVFDRAANGTLTAAGTVATGGLGTGAGTGSQGALALNDNGRWLFAV